MMRDVYVMTFALLVTVALMGVLFAKVIVPAQSRAAVEDARGKYDGVTMETSETRVKHPGDWTINGEKCTCVLLENTLLCEISQ